MCPLISPRANFHWFHLNVSLVSGLTPSFFSGANYLRFHANWLTSFHRVRPEGWRSFWPFHVKKVHHFDRPSRHQNCDRPRKEPFPLRPCADDRSRILLFIRIYSLVGGWSWFRVCLWISSFSWVESTVLCQLDFPNHFLFSHHTSECNFLIHRSSVNKCRS
jgi:hypothetical protein